MATLSKREAKKYRASKHAGYSHRCGICNRVVFGNGGWSSHVRMHKRELSGLMGLNLMGESYSWTTDRFDEYVAQHGISKPKSY